MDELRDEFAEENPEELADLSFTDTIEILAQREGRDEEFMEWAKLLRPGSSEREELRNPEWIAFITQHIDEIRRERPGLFDRRYIREAIGELERAGVR